MSSDESQASMDAYLDMEERDSRPIGDRTWLKMAQAIFRHRLPLLGGVVMVLVGTGAAVLEPRLFGYAIDEAILPRRWETLQRLSALYFFLVCTRIIGAISQAYFFEVLGQGVTQDLRVKLLAHLEALPVSVFDRNPAGRLMTRVTNDVAALNEMFSAGFVSMFSNVLLVAGILGWLLALDLRLGLISASVFPLLVALSAFFSKKLKIAYREARSKLSALNAFLAENFLGMKVVHLFNREKLHLERFERINRWYADAQVGSIRISALFQPSITIAAGASIALVIWFGGRAVLSGEIQVGVLVAYFAYVLTLFQPLREIADKWNIFLSGMTSAERIFSVLEWETEISAERACAQVPALQGVRGHIVFENVWFAYETGSEGPRWVLKDFSLELAPGTRLGVVGHTGAGKTTLISLLMRFYEPQKGRILLDGRDLREYDKRALRAAIGIVQQDVFLFTGSMEENVTFWGSSRRGFSEIAGSFSGSGSLQERGSNLSAGERQMVAFSRALASDPSIWILDEATANMDSGTEGSVQRLLESTATGKTTILIAHRLATVRSADLVIVLHKGALVEKGTHLDLMKQNGLYARLYRYQSAAENAALRSSGSTQATEPVSQ